jgi:hypothetical protein
MERAMQAGARKAKYVSRTLSALALLTVVFTYSTTPTTASASTPATSMELAILNLSNPGDFETGATLHLIAVAFIHGDEEPGGVIYVTSNDPSKSHICNIAMASKHFYCNIEFPNAGTFTITARYRGPYEGSLRNLKTKSISATITSPPTQPTETLVSPALSYYQETADGQYTVTAGVLVSVIQSFDIQLLSPGGGTITVSDAAGNVLCQINVPAAPTATALSCTGGPFATPPQNPITASYSGTSAGNNDGQGTSYSGSSGLVTIGPY